MLHFSLKKKGGGKRATRASITKSELRVLSPAVYRNIDPVFPGDVYKKQVYLNKFCIFVGTTTINS